MEIAIIQSKIYEVRGTKVMLDKDLAELYQVTTGNLNKAVKRNIKRFPPDFMFQLTTEEWEALRGCLKIELRWPLLFYFKLKSFGFSSKKEFINLLLKVSSFQTVFLLP